MLDSPISPIRHTFPSNGPKPFPISIDMLPQQTLPHRRIVDPLRYPHRRDLIEPVRLRHQEIETEPRNPRTERRRVPPVTRYPVIETLLQHDTQRLAQPQDHADRRGVVVHVLRPPVLCDEAEIEVPRRRLRRPRVDHLQRPRSDRDRTYPRRSAQALLTARIGVIDVPSRQTRNRFRPVT